MRILVISDSHGDSYSIKRAIAEQPTARIVFFLGDGERDIDLNEHSRPNLYIHKVRGKL